MVLITLQDYAIETPLQLLEGEAFYEASIKINTKSSIAAINFVLKVQEIVLLLISTFLLRLTMTGFSLSYI